MIKVIGIAGYARCGKDTFVGIARNILTANGYHPFRVAFADKLKEEVEATLRANKFKTTVYTEDSAAKKLNRPLLVWWGCQRRYDTADTGGLYWVDQVDAQLRGVQDDAIKQDRDLNKIVALVSDCRFANETSWVHEKWGGKVIHLKRYVTETLNGESVKHYDPAPNEEEAKNDPFVQEAADLRVEWESKGKHTADTATKDTYLQGEVLKALNSLNCFNEPLSL